MAKIIRLLFILMLAVLLLAACNLPGRVNQGTGSTSLTQAAQTIDAQITQNANNQLPSATSAASLTSQPTITIAPTSTNAPAATATEKPCDAAGYVKDVTIPDGTEMTPNETFEKTWRIENLGTCTWNSSYQIVFDSGHAMNGPAAQKITNGTVAPGDQVDITIELTAPASPGTYRGTYQLRNDNGVIFTASGFWVEIEVVEPDAYSSKSSYEIEENNFGDLDEGVTPPAGPGDDDFYFTVITFDDKFLDPTNGAEFRSMGSDEPTYEDCNEANLNDNEITVDEDIVGEWFCFVTSEGRLGKFMVVSLEPEDPNEVQVLELDYLTWETP